MLLKPSFPTPERVDIPQMVHGVLIDKLMQFAASLMARRSCCKSGEKPSLLSNYPDDFCPRYGREVGQTPGQKTTAPVMASLARRLTNFKSVHISAVQYKSDLDSWITRFWLLLLLFVPSIQILDNRQTTAQ